MEDKNSKGHMNNNQNDENNNENKPLEIPENDAPRETKPVTAVKNGKQKKTMNKVKAVYAFAMILAIGAAFTAKIATEKALGNLTPIESDYVTLASESQKSKDSDFLTEEPDFEVRNNVTNVPDERKESEKSEENTQVSTTEKSKFSKPYEDYFALPLGTDILRDYSPDKPMYSATMGDWRTHNGIDFQGVDGDQVKAIAYGTVSKIYDDALLGTVVEIDHGNGVIAKYCGLNKETLEVKAENTVEAGTLLGYLGTVPFEKTDISHLHFEIIYNGKNTDPLELMGR